MKGWKTYNIPIYPKTGQVFAMVITAPSSGSAFDIAQTTHPNASIGAPKEQ